MKWRLSLDIRAHTIDWRVLALGKEDAVRGESSAGVCRLSSRKGGGDKRLLTGNHRRTPRGIWQRRRLQRQICRISGGIPAEKGKAQLQIDGSDLHANALPKELAQKQAAIYPVNGAPSVSLKAEMLVLEKVNGGIAVPCINVGCRNGQAHTRALSQDAMREMRALVNRLICLYGRPHSIAIQLDAPLPQQGCRKQEMISEVHEPQTTERMHLPLWDESNIIHAPPRSTRRTAATTAACERRRQHFLLSLKGKNSGKFKRYRGLPLRYAGGKSLAVGHVINALPTGVTRLVSPFFGGGSVEIACNRELGMQVIGYDIFHILTTYWQMQIESPRKLAERVSAWKPDKATYQRVKERLKAHWTGENPISDRLELAAHYWFNHNLSYGPGFLGWASKIYEDPQRVQRLIDKVRNFNCRDLCVRHAAFEQALPRHRKDFLYCDPPYFLDGDSKMFRGIYPQRNFPVHHNGFNHARLRDLLMAHEGGFILSYNDCAVIREWYAPFKIMEVEWQYTLGQGEARIGKNRIENGSRHHVKKSHELLIVSHG